MAALPETETAHPARQRDVSLDLLRAIAILEVVFAHSGVSGWLFQVRNFGVPLLILLSGWSIGLSIARRPISFPAYLVRRARRLVLPAWGFLVAYFLFFLVLDGIGLTARNYSWSTILDSFTFHDGIGYVWVIRVNLLVSLIALPLIALDRRVRSHAVFIAACAAAILASELAWLAFDASGHRTSETLLHEIIEDGVFYLTGYGALFAIGLRLPRLPNRAVLALSLLSGVVFLGIAAALWHANGSFVPTQGYKYPPQLYYLAYGLFISLALVAGRGWLVRAIPEGPTRRLAVFIGSNTLSIYLWHIPAVEIGKELSAAGWMPDIPLVSWLAIAAFAIVATRLQHVVVNALAPRLTSGRLRRRLPLSHG